MDRICRLSSVEAKLQGEVLFNNGELSYKCVDEERVYREIAERGE